MPATLDGRATGSAALLFTHTVLPTAIFCGMMALSPAAQAATPWESELQPADIGAPAIAGSMTVGPAGVQITAAGADVGGTSDQCFYAYRTQEGDFDVKARVTALDNVDVWTKAGLMARETLDPGSSFAAAIATPTLSGALFQARTTQGGRATALGAFPANLPEAWLRLRREGSSFSAFASIDGQHWHPLGSATMTLPTSLFLGFAVASHQTNQVAVAQLAGFAETGPVASGAVTLPREAVGPSSRRTGLVITEIMYRASTVEEDNNLDFVELLNANPFPEDIGGYSLTGSIDYTFPKGTVINGGGFLLVARNPQAITNAAGLTRVLGPFTGVLPREGSVKLCSRIGAVLLDISYSSRPPWPVAADGTGHSLVLARPSYGEGDPQAWSQSRFKGGSPGQVDSMPTGALEHISINEFLANSGPNGEDYIELYNHSNQDVDISGCGLSDLRGFARFQAGPGTVIFARGFLVLKEPQLDFALDAKGEAIFFTTPDFRRVIDAVRFEAQGRGVSRGRYPDGSVESYALSASTPGGANAKPASPDVVINEIMYHPVSEDDDDEYIELYNRGGQTVDLGGWRFEDGVEFEFPKGTLLPAGGYLVTACNAAHLRMRYPQLNSGNTVGNYRGRLSNSGERIALARPEQAAAGEDPFYILVDEVTYGTGGSWGLWADGGGSSLERIDPHSNSRRASNWADSDETGKSEWTTVEITGVLDHGSGAADALHVLMLGAGECLVDDVDLRSEKATQNQVANGTFDGGISGWTAQGDHVRSTFEETGGSGGSGCLHVRASNQGDTLANHVRSSVRQASLLSVGSTATIRAKVKWLRGLPEMLVRLKGNYLEAFGRLPLPGNLGSPGLPNSQARPDPGPAVFEVTHLPVLPAIDAPVVVTARIEHRDGISQAQLVYRLDPSTNRVSVAMLDDGTNGDDVAGDGVFSATIPAPNSNAMAAFYVDATSAGSPQHSSRFPAAAPERECLVRFGEVVPASSFGTYRLWFTAATVKTWTQRPVLSNDELDGTFVYGNQRVVYNIGARYSGSPWHQGSYTSPVGGVCTYAFRLPGDNRVLGTSSFNKLHALGNTPGDDGTLQCEQTAYWMVRQLNLPWNYQRYVQVYVNGSKRGPIMEDTQVPAADLLREYFPNDADGDLYKVNGWYESESGGGGNFRLASWCALNNYTTTGGARKLARYRWNWGPRAVGASANNYTNLFALVDAANTPQGGPYEDNLAGLADMNQWLRTFAIEHAVGNWDSFGNRNAQNMYAYKPARDKWKLIIWDYNIVLGNSGSDGPSGDNLFQFNGSDRGMRRIYSTPAFVRVYLQTLREIANGPMASTNVDPVIDARYAALKASGVTPSSPSGIKSWIRSRRRYLENYLTNFQTSFTMTAPAGPEATVSENWVVLSGIAPLEVSTIRVNAVPYPVQWTSLLEWSVKVPLTTSSTHVTVQGYQADGEPMTGASAVLDVTCTATFESPEDSLVINEVMHHPALPGAEYVEILNRSSSSLFDLSGFRLSGLDFDFPAGLLVGPGEFVMVAADRTAFTTAYGCATGLAGEFQGSLSPAGETLRLVRKGVTPANDVVIDEVTYGAAPPWPSAASEPGVALQLIDPDQDNDRLGNWDAVSAQSLVNPAWRFVSVTGQATGGRLLVYHSPYQPEPDPFDIAGRWDGAIDFGGQPYDMSTVFEHLPAGGWSGEFIDVGGSGSTIPLANIRVTTVTNVYFAFPPEYGTVNWRGRLSPDGQTITGTFTQIVGGQTATAPFAIRRFHDPDARLGGEVCIDDLSLVAGSEPGAGANLLRNGDFESALDGIWSMAENHSSSSLSTEIKHSGNASLHLVASRGGADVTTAMWQDFEPLAPGQNYTLSYWYLPSSNGDELTVRMEDNSLVCSHSIRPGKTATPGAVNSTSDALPLLPPLFLSEIQIDNITGPTDRLGHHVPWVEIHNAGATAVSLQGICLSDNPENLTLWPFPDDAVIGPGEYLLVWLDGVPGESTADEWHANFQPPATDGLVMLCRREATRNRVLDALRYGRIEPDQSIGVVIDSTGTRRLMALVRPTPRAANSASQSIPPVCINEWMARNSHTIAEPNSGRFEDWIELYNPNAFAVDMSGWFLSDDLANPKKWTVSERTYIDPNGFLLIWADERSALNDGAHGLHANFKLAGEGEAIALSAPDGTLVDSVVFGAQQTDISVGLWPDGSAGAVQAMTRPSPGSANISDKPVTQFSITAVSLQQDGTLAITWQSKPQQRYQVQYQDALGGAQWLNLGQPVTAIGSSASSLDQAPLTMAQRFYRVVEAP